MALWPKRRAACVLSYPRASVFRKKDFSYFSSFFVCGGEAINSSLQIQLLGQYCQIQRRMKKMELTKRSMKKAERHKLSYNKSRGKEDCQRLDKVAFRRRACVRGKVTAAEPYSVGCFGSLDTHLQSPLKRKHNLCGDDSGKSPSGWTV
ncbi:uncharacterized protein PADG_12242 [Paracoccidioides brasiliensis Pb18]|uniref:Uncharacterized protein n=1 Tax=Paracoccidioides brasiliensis (strain Pb18) TaxID=502780 RepID=A0A0A0HW88_PARBD|nr:uncharacterized protein PADG_12242 [Paracoccidioides brasiliensis Pb18]KGM91670.1 hypothetical protein PADG_12242 [Paracoccidioides brasiliensis Pb18]